MFYMFKWKQPASQKIYHYTHEILLSLLFLYYFLNYRNLNRWSDNYDFISFLYILICFFFYIVNQILYFFVTAIHLCFRKYSVVLWCHDMYTHTREGTQERTKITEVSWMSRCLKKLRSSNENLNAVHGGTFLWVVLVWIRMASKGS